MTKYLGAYHGAFLIQRGDCFFQQFNDGGFQETWRDEQIPYREVERIKALGRAKHDMVFEIGSDNIPRGAVPIWEADLVEYLTWHRDNDPSPYSERAAAALAELSQERKG